MPYNKTTGLYEGCIYMITNNINGKIYIGQTRQNLGKRISQHRTNSKLEQSHSLIDIAIKKYGFENFRVEELCKCYGKTRKELVAELSKMEKFYISSCNAYAESNNYNILSGGLDVSDRCYVPVDQYSVDGEYIQSFGAIIEATDYLGLDPSAFANVSACCNGRHSTAYGYVWRYKGDAYNKYPIKTRLYRKVNQYSLNYEYITTHETIASVGRLMDESNKPRNSAALVREAIKNGYKVYGYRWYYADDPNQPDKTKVVQ